MDCEPESGTLAREREGLIAECDTIETTRNNLMGKRYAGSQLSYLCGACVRLRSVHIAGRTDL